jgi:NADH pyrophosphatase NudC (nudix superfamily)
LCSWRWRIANRGNTTVRRELLVFGSTTCSLPSTETIHDGLRREVREETGLDIEPDALTGVYKNMPRGIIALVFRCKITGGHLATNDEVTAFRWADQADIHQFTSEAYAVRLLDALREGTTPAVRQHDGTELLD